MQSVIVAATPVVDIDGTFFVQGAVFLALWVVLRPLLFERWLEVRARRIESIDGALAKASELRVEADALGTDYEGRLGDAREQANLSRSKAFRDEESRQAEAIAIARSEANTQLERERSKITKDAHEARAALSARVDELAGEIATKLLGRSA